MHTLIAISTGYTLVAFLLGVTVLYGNRRELRYGTILNGVHWSAAFLMGFMWPLLTFTMLHMMWNERKSLKP